MSMAVGLLLLRLVVGLVMAGHGTQKLFGWFSGSGWTSTVGLLGSQGLQPAWLWALLAGVGELLGGLLVALGLLSPFGEVAIFAAMFMVVFKFHWKQGLWITQGGYEYGLVLLTTSIMLAFTGPGNYSLDTLFHVRLPLLPLFGLGVLAAIIVDGSGIAISRQKPTAQSEDQVQEA